MTRSYRIAVPMLSTVTILAAVVGASGFGPHARAQQHAAPRRQNSAPDPREQTFTSRGERLLVSLAPPDGTAYASAACQRNAVEQCNGLDDNCDGRIDNGCGYSSGEVQVTIAWGTGADLDLTVENPDGESISWRTEDGYGGGRMDQRTEGCDGTRLGVAIAASRRQSALRLENVFFNTPSWSRTGRLARGQYYAAVRAADLCGGHTTDAVMSIAVRGHVIGTVRLHFGDSDQTIVVPFTISDAD